MLLLTAVLILIAGTEVIAGLGDNVLPYDTVRYIWWTMHLYSCAAASIQGGFGRFHDRTSGFIAVTLFFISYNLWWDSYLAMMPATADFAWARVYMLVNVVIPMILVGIGPMIPVFRRG